MELRDIQRVYLVGIGGIGMSGLARYFHHLGCIVCGYDKTSTDLTHELHNEGIKITYDDNVDCIPMSFEKPLPDLASDAGVWEISGLEALSTMSLESMLPITTPCECIFGFTD